MYILGQLGSGYPRHNFVPRVPILSPKQSRSGGLGPLIQTHKDQKFQVQCCLELVVATRLDWAAFDVSTTNAHTRGFQFETREEPVPGLLRIGRRGRIVEAEPLLNSEVMDIGAISGLPSP